MLILWKARQKDPARGYATTFLRQLEDVLGTCLDRGDQDRGQRRRPQPGWPGREGRASSPAGSACPPVSRYITGDDLAPRIGDLQAAGHALANLDTGVPLAAAGLPVGHAPTPTSAAGASPPRCRPGPTWSSARGSPTPAWSPGRPPGGTAGSRDDFDALAGARRRRARDRVRAAGDRRQLQLPRRDHRPALPRLPDRRGRRRRQQRDHQASGHRRPGVGRHRHRPAAVRDRRARATSTRMSSRTSTRCAIEQAGPDRVALSGTKGSPPPADAQGRDQHARRLPQHDDDGPHRAGHRGQGRAGRAAAVRPCSAARSSSARSTCGCCASTVPTPPPTSRPPRTCGSRSRTPTSARSAARSPT